VIIVSGCLILTTVNLIMLIRMGNITDKLVSSCARSIVTFDISLHEVCVRVGVRYVITKFSRMDSLPNFVTHGAPQRALRALDSSAFKERKKREKMKNEIRWFFNLKTILFHFFFHFFNVPLYIIEQDKSQTNVSA